MKFLRTIGILVVVGFALVGIVFTAVLIGMQFGLLNVRGSIAERNSYFGQVLGTEIDACADVRCAWQDTAEWAVVREGLRKDAVVIDRVASETGIPARLIAAVVVPEQIRFFTSERETFKQIFEPLKILGTLSQFSLGVSGIKQDTAEEIERRIPAGLEGLIIYPADTNRTALLYERLTDQHDHYYSYLYAALFIKEILNEWSQAGHPIGTKPGVIVTLFNIGFQNSRPNAAPQVGGAVIEIGGTEYTFGSLGESFYYSTELTEVFPHR